MSAASPNSSNETNTPANPAPKGNAYLVYILYLVAIAVGITSIVGLIMAYVAKETAPDWLKSHYHNQINIFWKGLLYLFTGMLLLSFTVGSVFITLLISPIVLIWYIIRIVKGMQALSKGEAYTNPSSWWF